MGSKKFSIAAEDLNSTIKYMFVGAIRRGVTEGFDVAVRFTRQDSSNAATHWLIGVQGKSNAASRVLGKPSDLRATKSGGVKHPLVGYRGEHRTDSGASAAISDAIVEREVNTIINVYAKGISPETGFYYFNALGESGEYAENADINFAGEQALAAAVAVFEREMSVANVRRYRLK